MAQFKVVIDFSTTVSEDAADELEILVADFVQLLATVVMNDALDEVSASMNPAGIPQSEAIVPIDSFGSPIFTPDEGSDAPISAMNFEDDGPTDFDRR